MRDEDFSTLTSGLIRRSPPKYSGVSQTALNKLGLSRRLHHTKCDTIFFKELTANYMAGRGWVVKEKNCTLNLVRWVQTVISYQ